MNKFNQRKAKSEKLYMPYVRNNRSGWEASARRLQIEAAGMSQLEESKREKYSASPNIDNVHEWICAVHGPQNTPYQGGTFFVELRFSAEYPIKPPSCNFLTRIYHMNVTAEGKMEIPLLKKRWKATNSITDILDGIYTVLGLLYLPYLCLL